MKKAFRSVLAAILASALVFSCFPASALVSLLDEPSALQEAAAAYLADENAYTRLLLARQAALFVRDETVPLDENELPVVKYYSTGSFVTNTYYYLFPAENGTPDGNYFKDLYDSVTEDFAITEIPAAVSDVISAVIPRHQYDEYTVTSPYYSTLSISGKTPAERLPSLEERTKELSCSEAEAINAAAGFYSVGDLPDELLTEIRITYYPEVKSVSLSKSTAENLTSKPNEDEYLYASPKVSYWTPKLYYFYFTQKPVVEETYSCSETISAIKDFAACFGASETESENSALGVFVRSPQLLWTADESSLREFAQGIIAFDAYNALGDEYKGAFIDSDWVDRVNSAISYYETVCDFRFSDCAEDLRILNDLYASGPDVNADNYAIRGGLVPAGGEYKAAVDAFAELFGVLEGPVDDDAIEFLKENDPLGSGVLLDKAVYSDVLSSLKNNLAVYELGMIKEAVLNYISEYDGYQNGEYELSPAELAWMLGDLRGIYDILSYDNSVYGGYDAEIKESVFGEEPYLSIGDLSYLIAKLSASDVLGYYEMSVADFISSYYGYLLVDLSSQYAGGYEEPQDGQTVYTAANFRDGNIRAVTELMREVQHTESMFESEKARCIYELVNADEPVPVQAAKEAADILFSRDGVTIGDLYASLLDGIYGYLAEHMLSKAQAVCRIYDTYVGINDRSYLPISITLDTYDDALFDLLVSAGYEFNEEESALIQRCGEIRAQLEEYEFVSAEPLDEDNYDPVSGEYVLDENGEKVSTGYYTERKGDSLLDLARTDEVTYLVSKERVRGFIDKIDDLITGPDFAKLTGIGGDDVSLEDADLHDRIYAALSESVYSDAMMNTVVEKLYPALCDTIEQIASKYDGTTYPVTTEKMNVGQNLATIQICGSMDLKVNSGGLNKLRDALHNAGLDIYPGYLANTAEKYGFTEAAAALRSACRWGEDDGSSTQGLWRRRVIKTFMPDCEEYEYNPALYTYNRETGSYDFDKLVWNIDGSADRFDAAVNMIFDSLLPIARVLLTNENQSFLLDDIMTVSSNRLDPLTAIVRALALTGTVQLDISLNKISVRMTVAGMDLYEKIFRPVLHVLGADSYERTDGRDAYRVDLEVPSQGAGAEEYARSITEPIRAAIDQFSYYPVDKILSILPGLCSFIGSGQIRKMFSGLYFSMIARFEDFDVGITSGFAESGIISNIVTLFLATSRMSSILKSCMPNIPAATGLGDFGVIERLGGACRDVDAVLKYLATETGYDLPISPFDLPAFDQARVAALTHGGEDPEADDTDVLWYVWNYLAECLRDPSFSDLFKQYLPEGSDFLVDRIAADPFTTFAALTELFVPQFYPAGDESASPLRPVSSSVRKLGAAPVSGSIGSGNGTLSTEAAGLMVRDVLLRAAADLRELYDAMCSDSAFFRILSENIGIDPSGWDEQTIAGSIPEFDDGDVIAFISGVSELLKPLGDNLFAYILTGADLDIIKGISGSFVLTSPGGDGYTEGLKPVLEALGVKAPTDKETFAAAAEAFGSYSGYIASLITARVTELSDGGSQASFVNTVVNLLKYADSDSFATDVDNMLRPLYTLIDTVRPFADIRTLLSGSINDLMTRAGVTNAAGEVVILPEFISVKQYLSNANLLRIYRLISGTNVLIDSSPSATYDILRYFTEDVEGSMYSPLADAEKYPGNGYGKNWTREKAEYIADNIDVTVTNVLKAAGIDDPYAYFKNALYTPANASIVLSEIKESIDSYAGQLDDPEYAFAFFRDVTGADLSAYGSITQVEFEDGDREAFTAAIVSYLRPIEPVVAFLLTGDSADDIYYEYTVDGESAVIHAASSDGYVSSVIPALEAFGCEPAAPQEYLSAAANDPDALITGALDPLLDRLEIFFENPSEAFDALPGLIYFINCGGFSTVLGNLFAPLTGVTEAVESALGVRTGTFPTQYSIEWNTVVDLLSEMLSGSGDLGGLDLSALRTDDPLSDLTVGTLERYASATGKEDRRMVWADDPNDLANRAGGVTLFATMLVRVVEDNEEEVKALAAKKLGDSGGRYVAMLIESVLESAASAENEAERTDILLGSLYIGIGGLNSYTGSGIEWDSLISLIAYMMRQSDCAAIRAVGEKLKQLDGFCVLDWLSALLDRLLAALKKLIVYLC